MTTRWMTLWLAILAGGSLLLNGCASHQGELAAKNPPANSPDAKVGDCRLREIVVYKYGGQGLLKPTIYANGAFHFPNGSWNRWKINGDSPSGKVVKVSETKMEFTHGSSSLRQGDNTISVSFPNGLKYSFGFRFDADLIEPGGIGVFEAYPN